MPKYNLIECENHGKAVALSNCGAVKLGLAFSIYEITLQSSSMAPRAKFAEFNK